MMILPYNCLFSFYFDIEKKTLEGLSDKYMSGSVLRDSNLYYLIVYMCDVLVTFTTGYQLTYFNIHGKL